MTLTARERISAVMSSLDSTETERELALALEEALDEITDLSNQACCCGACQ